MEKKTKQTKAENELQALRNALNSLELIGYNVYWYDEPRRKNKYFLVDDKGTSITGSWEYDKINHFILGYGKAIEKYSNQLLKTK